MRWRRSIVVSSLLLGIAGADFAAPACAEPREAPIVLVQQNCGPCQTSGPNRGKKQCCELVGGDWLCKWVKC